MSVQKRWGRRAQVLSARNAGVSAALAFALVAGLQVPVAAQETAKSFVDDFSNFQRSRWYVSDGWSNGDYQNCTWSSKMIKIADGVLTLSFDERPYKERNFSCAEVQTKQLFSYGTFEARLKTDSGAGLNNAFFTFIGPQNGKPHDEIDFEAITKDTSRIEVNTYVDGKPHHGGKIDVPGGTDKEFNDYAIVWEPDQIRWFVNGQLVKTAASDILPKEPQKIFFSIWGSDTMKDWMGDFSFPGRRLNMLVDRVAYTELGADCQFPESVACKLK
ncbi:MAG: family 16 glycosylhydrolase [Rhizobiaceae bacterium]|nr:family 16 glycosylhydrolase [Rhizobiaceae bacterium]